MSEREFHVVVFGATGFTGKYVIEELVRLTSKGQKLRWAVAGRNALKLRRVLEEVGQLTAVDDVPSVAVIEASVASYESLAAMCRRTRVVLNCVGPYCRNGEPVVRACIQFGAHQLDICGEPHYLEWTQLRYNELAKRANVYVIGACAVGSIPCEMVLQLMVQKSLGDVNSVDCIFSGQGGPDGYTIHTGTWETMLSEADHVFKMKALRRKLFREPVPSSRHPLKSRGILSFCEDVNSWIVPFPINDETVVNRTQHFNYHHRKLRPVQLTSYITCSSLMAAIATLVFCFFIAVLAFFKFTRLLLIKFPEVFTFGKFSKAGPTRFQVETASFSMTLLGEAYGTKLNIGAGGSAQQHDEAPSKRIVVNVTGPDPGYVTTAICLTQAALCVLEEQDKMPLEGGVLTPGAAFYDTSLIDRLSSRGIKFDVQAMY